LANKHHYHSERLRDIYSEVLGRDAAVDIFLPFQFAETGASLPLLLLNDGQDGEAIALHHTLEELTRQKKICDLIVVAVHAGDRLQEYGVANQPDYKGRGSRARHYAKFVMNELIPYLHYRYPVSPLTHQHAIAGFSLGGLSAFDLSWQHPNYFGLVGAFSGSFWWRKRDTKSRFYSDYRDRIMHSVVRRSRKREGLKFWFQTGQLDEQADRNKNGVIDSIDDTLDLIVELTKKGYRPFHDIQYVELPHGKHDLPTWKMALPLFLQWAFPEVGS
jgi:enterochelin esterase-like enzyme